MVFSEPAFLFLFLPVVLLAYFVCGRGARNWVLCLASLAFYALGEPRFVPILLVSIALNYWIAIGLDNWRGTLRAKYLLAFGLASDLGLLLYFKYAFWLSQSADKALAMLGSQFSFSMAPLILPLGISFFTFHKMSYKIDVFRSTSKVRRNPLELTLYILIFPQLIAGPIIRYHEIADQITKRTVTVPGFALGVRRFIIGLGKKMILANSVALVADQIFAIPANELTFSVAWLGILCYALQIYFDFSGYSDMAIGLGHMFGFRFPENFHYPYAAQSITDFWRRWHMSLSRWFRDYLYIPLGGNRKGARRTYINLMTIFFLCGLWHGASWTFVLWGIFHGAFLVIERLGWGKILEKLPRPLRHAYALLVILIGWVFFRAEGVRFALSFVGAMFGFGTGDSARYNVGMFLDNVVILALIMGVIAATPISPMLARAFKGWKATTLQGRPRPAFSGGLAVLSFLSYSLILFVSIVLVVSGTYNPFIYYRF